MGLVKEDRQESRWWGLLLLAGLVFGLALRLYLASLAKTPGHGDSAFYYTVAKNIVDGRGPVIDYITYFFEGLLPLPHYAGDFWNPAAAYLVAIPIAVLGKTINNALLAGIAAGIVPAAVGYLAASHYTGSRALAVLCAVLTFFSPFLVWFSVTTEAIIFAGAFGSVALYLIMKGIEAPRYFLLAGVFTGLANLMRQDNVLLLGAIAAGILLAPLTWRRRAVIGAAALGLHLLVLSPLLIENYVQLHEIFPSGPGKTAFLTSYEDFHSYGKRIDWYTLRATWGLQGILKRRLHTATENLGQVEYFLDPVLAWLGLIALVDVAILQRRFARLRLLLPVFVFALLEYLFYTFVASFSGPGSLIKCLATLMPFICLLIVDWIASRLRTRVVMALAVVALSAYLGYQGFQKNYFTTTYYNDIYRHYVAVRSMVLKDAAARALDPGDITIMARDTWDVFEGTGFKVVMIPNNDLPTILFVARHYNVEYMLLPAPRKALEDIYLGTTPDPHFSFVGAVPQTDWTILHLQYDVP